MRRLSLNARTHVDAEHSGEVEVVLIRFTHPDLDAPIRLSTDLKDRLSLSPLLYGTRSAWPEGGAPQDYLFVVLDALLPDDLDEGPPSAQLVLEVLSRDMATPLRQTTDRATVDIAVVLADAPDDPEIEYRGLELVSAEGDAGQIVLTISRENEAAEPWPARRMTRDVLPGLHR